MYICMCHGITEREIRQCAREGACTLPDLQLSLGVGTACGRCRDAAHEVLNETRSGDSITLRIATA
jgi:bacterioferritin-associated ferredoxin